MNEEYEIWQAIIYVGEKETLSDIVINRPHLPSPQVKENY